MENKSGIVEDKVEKEEGRVHMKMGVARFGRGYS